MTTLMVLLSATLMIMGTLGGWKLMLNSACSAENWRQEVSTSTKRLKTKGIPQWSFKSLSSCSSSITRWEFKGSFLKNEKGSVEFLGASLLLILTLALGLMIHLWNHRHNQISEHFKQTLCLKEAILETNLMVSRINKLNVAISTGEVTSWALILLGIGLATKPTWEQVKKTLQLAQEAQWIKSQAKLLSLKQKSCSLPPHIWLSPYKWSGRLSRGIDGRALMRSKQSLWPIKTPLMIYFARWKSASELSPTLNWEIY